MPKSLGAICYPYSLVNFYKDVLCPLESPFLISSEVRAFLHERLDVLLDEGGQVAAHAAFGQSSMISKPSTSIEVDTFSGSPSSRPFRTASNVLKATPNSRSVFTVKKTHYRNTQSKGIVTVHGAITISRDRRRCPHCKRSVFPVETPLGLDTRYTKHLKRLATRCCGFWAFGLASQSLKELCGITLSPMTVRKIAYETAGVLSESLPDNAEIRNDFQKAKGVVRKRFSVVGLVRPDAFDAVIGRLCGNGAGVIGVARFGRGRTEGGTVVAGLFEQELRNDCVMLSGWQQGGVLEAA